MSKKGGGISNFLIRLVVTAVSVSFAIAMVPGLNFMGSSDDLLVDILALSLFLALINVSLKPVLQVLSLPITVLTLGLFALVVNTAMFYLAAWCASAFFGVTLVISGFGAAFVASVIISIATWLISRFLD